MAFEEGPGHMRLSAREEQIGEALARGLQAKEIAAELGLTPGTVRSYLKTIYSKLNVHSGLELVSKLGPRPTSEISAGSFLDIAHGILSARDQHSLREVFVAGLVSATGAGQVGFWNVTIGGGRDLVTTACSDPPGPVPNSSFLAHLVEFGWAAENDPRGTATRQYSSIGITVLSTAGLRHCVILSDPARCHFQAADLKAVRVLGALAAQQYYAAALR